jgi:hypothetical protein
VVPGGEDQRGRVAALSSGEQGGICAHVELSDGPASSRLRGPYPHHAFAALTIITGEANMSFDVEPDRSVSVLPQGLHRALALITACGLTGRERAATRERRPR